MLTSIGNPESPAANAAPFSLPKSRARGFWIAAVLALGAFLTSGLDKLHESDELNPYDTSAYLSEARSIHYSGGPLGVLAGCFRGTYAEANRMPLYTAMLSVLPVDTLRVLGWAKVLTLMQGAAGILVCLLAVRKLFGPGPAILAAGALACNTACLTQSTTVCCEPLLAIWVLLAWCAMVNYLRSGRGGGWIGLFIGLAYVTKGTGLFLLPAALGTVLYHERRRFWRSRQLWLGVLAFVLVASPILARNVRRYASPFYTSNRSFLWVNNPDELFSPDRTIREPTPLSYWRTHTGREIVARMGRGAFQQGVYTVVGCGQTYLLNERLGLKAWPVGLLVLVLAALAWFSKPARPAVAAAAAILAVFALFFTWYPARDIRFIFPVVPILIALAGVGAFAGIEKLSAALGPSFARNNEGMNVDSRSSIGVEDKFRGNDRNGLGWGIAIALVFMATGATATLAATRPNLRRNPLNCYEIPPGYDDLRKWVIAHASPAQPCLLGPSQAYAYFWSGEVEARTRAVPWTRSLEEFDRAVSDLGARYVVVDFSTLRNRALLRNWIEQDGESVRLRRVPPGWKVAFCPGAPAAQGSSATPYIILERESPSGAPAPAGKLARPSP